MRETERLVQAIEQQLGRVLVPQVRNAFLQVPRHLFVQQYYEQQGNSLSWDLVRAASEKIYGDEALVTRIDSRGMPSSSTSQPSVMAVQLEALALAPGQRVLEIGVGTGYNAALLGKLVDNAGQVISIDIDEDLVEQAKRHLAEAGIQNVLAVAGDGFVGEGAYTPYDRLLATCSIRWVPRAWIEQLKTGGRLVGNWLTPLASLFLCVEKNDRDELEGSLLDLCASYMEMRTGVAAPPRQKVDWTYYDRLPSSWIPLPQINRLLQNAVYSLLLQCFLPNLRKRYRSKDDQVQLYLTTEDMALLVQDDALLLSGNEEIGYKIQQSVDLYNKLGRPPITAYHVTFQQREVMIRLGEHCFQLSFIEL